MSGTPEKIDEGGRSVRASKVEVENCRFFAMVWGAIVIVHMDNEPVLYGTYRESGYWTFDHAIHDTERMPALPYDVYDHPEFSGKSLVDTLRWLHDRTEEYGI